VAIEIQKYVPFLVLTMEPTKPTATPEHSINTGQKINRDMSMGEK
jgi:hypothetical protein